MQIAATLYNVLMVAHINVGCSERYSIWVIRPHQFVTQFVQFALKRLYM